MQGSDHFQSYDRNLRKVLLFEWLRNEHAERIIEGLQKRNAELRRRLLADGLAVATQRGPAG